MKTQNTNRGHVATSARYTGDGNWPPLCHHFNTTRLCTVQVVPFLALLHALEHLVELNLVFSNNLVAGKITVVLDCETKLGLLSVCNEDLLGTIVPDGVVGTFQLLGLVHFLTVQKHDRVRVERSYKTLGTVQILGLLHGKSENTLVGRRRWLVLSLGIFDGLKHGEETNVTGNNTASLAIRDDLQSLVLVDIELFDTLKWK